MPVSDAALVPVARLLAWGEAVYAAVGCDAAEARSVAAGLVDANRYGHDSHGIGITPQYVASVRAGRVGPGRRPRVVSDAGVLWRGEPTGAILPFAGHKGWALSVMCELLGGALTGGGAQNGHFNGAIVNNMLTLAFDPARLGTGGALEGEIASLARWVRASPPAGPGGGILLPGEPERRIAQARDRDGVPLPQATLRQPAACAESLGVGPLEG